MDVNKNTCAWVLVCEYWLKPSMIPSNDPTLYYCDNCNSLLTHYHNDFRVRDIHTGIFKQFLKTYFIFLKSKKITFLHPFRFSSLPLKYPVMNKLNIKQLKYCKMTRWSKCEFYLEYNHHIWNLSYNFYRYNNKLPSMDPVPPLHPPDVTSIEPWSWACFRYTTSDVMSMRGRRQNDHYWKWQHRIIRKSAKLWPIRFNKQ